MFNSEIQAFPSQLDNTHFGNRVLVAMRMQTYPTQANILSSQNQVNISHAKALLVHRLIFYTVLKIHTVGSSLKLIELDHQHLILALFDFILNLYSHFHDGTFVSFLVLIVSGALFFVLM